MSSSSLLSGFPLPPVRTVTFPVSTNSRTSATPAGKMKKKLLFRPPQSARNFLGFGFRSYSSRKSAITCGGVSEINESQFSDVVLKSDRPVLVEFVATWCGPCRLISPVIEWAAQVPTFSLPLSFDIQILISKF